MSHRESLANFWHIYNPMTVQCKFCFKDMEHLPLTIKHGQQDYTFHPHYCHDCSYEYVKLGGMTNHHLYKKIGDRMFRWSYEEYTKATRIWFIGSPGVPGVSPNKDLQLLKSFDENVSLVTPENVEDKLRLVLVFL